MRKVVVSLAAAAVLCGASAANAAISIGATSGDGMLVPNIVVGTPNNGTMPETVVFDTTTNTAGTLTPWFEFSNDLTGQYAFSVTASTGLFNGSTISLEQLTDTGFNVIAQSMGNGITLNMLTPVLQANTTYRFTYTFNAGAGGGAASGNASFMSAPLPEPATWAMMLLGFGGIGLAMRRRRRPALAQIA